MWRSQLELTGMPPAYGDVLSKRSHISRSFTAPSTFSDSRSRDSDPFRSNSDPQSASSPQSSASRSGNEDSSELTSVSHIDGAELVSPNSDYHPYTHARTSSSMLGSVSYTPGSSWLNGGRHRPQTMSSETQSVRSDSQRGTASLFGTRNFSFDV
jgi:hypothetical protein